jgi:DNA-binding response OmpR family regulator
MSRRCVLVIEDDKAIRRGVVDALKAHGYDPIEAVEARTGLKSAIESNIDLILLDVMLPHGDGFSILGQVRKARPTLPVIMVTARGSEDDRIRGLENGADDYIVKPFGVRELIARVEAVLRRSAERPVDVGRLQIGSLVVEFETRTIRRNGSEECGSLSHREADLLRYLAANPNRAIARDELLHRVWGLDPSGLETRTIDMHMARLREKIGNLPDGSPAIVTVRGKGYMLARAVETRLS